MSNRAIAYFQEQSCRSDATMETVLYNDKAIEALRKQVPMPVIHERTFWRYSHYCPSCACMLDREALKYCPECGKRLDWSNYELELKYVR